MATENVKTTVNDNKTDVDIQVNTAKFVNVEKDTKKYRKKKHYTPEAIRFYRLLDAIWASASAAGFRITSRIEATDIKSGKEFK